MLKRKTGTFHNAETRSRRNQGEESCGVRPGEACIPFLSPRMETAPKNSDQAGPEFASSLFKRKQDCNRDSLVESIWKVLTLSNIYATINSNNGSNLGWIVQLGREGSKPTRSNKQSASRLHPSGIQLH